MKVRGGIHAEISQRDDLLDRPVRKMLFELLPWFFFNTLLHTSTLNIGNYKVKRQGVSICFQSKTTEKWLISSCTISRSGFSSMKQEGVLLLSL